MKCNYTFSFSGKRVRLDKHFSMFLLLGKKGHFKEINNISWQFLQQESEMLNPGIRQWDPGVH